ncbi:hypothetical protein [Clostridium thermosuccinogenes]|nr:hypothetical protein [Pseudoclostridium thermosuccinogenes]
MVRNQQQYPILRNSKILKLLILQNLKVPMFPADRPNQLRTQKVKCLLL